MVYCDSITLNSKLLTKAWLKHNVPKFINKQQYKRIEQLFGWLIEPTLDFVMALANSEKFVNCSKMHLAINFTKFYLTMLNDIEWVHIYMYIHVVTPTSSVCHLALVHKKKRNISCWTSTRGRIQRVSLEINQKAGTQWQQREHRRAKQHDCCTLFLLDCVVNWISSAKAGGR